jgi:hypothetical protein
LAAPPRPRPRFFFFNGLPSVTAVWPQLLSAAHAEQQSLCTQSVNVSKLIV